jgi:hypothetical protein
MEETTFQQITIAPIHDTDGAPFRYRLSVDGFPPHLWTEPGIYNTPEEVVASFYPPLRVEYQAGILESLQNDKEVTFSLKDAYTRV